MESSLLGVLATTLGAGMLAGLLVAWPMGPLGQLAARLTVEKKRRAARQIALTTVIIDALLAAVVLGGVAALPEVKLGWHPWVMTLVGGALTLLGLELWRSTPKAAPGLLPFGLTRPWQCAVAYAVVHPGSLLLFTVAFGLLHAKGGLESGWPALLAAWLGVVLGVLLMWVGWLALIHRLKRRFEPSRLRVVFGRTLALTLTLGGAVLLWESGMPQWIWPQLPGWLHVMLV